MGIGDQVSKAMCETICRAGNGVAVYVTEGEKPDRKLVNLLRAAQFPPVTNMELDWSIPEPQEDTHASLDADEDDFVDLGAQKPKPNLSLFNESYDSSKDTDAVEVGASPAGLHQHPPVGSMPALLPGSRYSFYAIVDRGPQSQKGRSEVVRLKGSVLGQPISLEIPIASVDSITSQAGLSKKLIHLIAARSIIQGLEEQGSKEQVLHMGLQYGLLTGQTSFVAIDESGALPEVLSAPPAKASGVAHGGYAKVSVAGAIMSAIPPPPRAAASQDRDYAAAITAHPIAPASYSMTRSSSAAPAMAAQVSPGWVTPSSWAHELPIASLASSDDDDEDVDFAAGVRSHHSLRKSPVRSIGRASKPADLAPSIESSVEALARCQAFNGSFTPSVAIFHLLVGQDMLPSQPSLLQDVPLDEKQKDTLWCSILVVAYLAANFVDEEDVWTIFTDKTIAWAQEVLSGNGQSNEHTQNLIKQIRESASQFVVKK